MLSRFAKAGTLASAAAVLGLALLGAGGDGVRNRIEEGGVPTGFDRVEHGERTPVGGSERGRLDRSRAERDRQDRCALV